MALRTNCNSSIDLYRHARPSFCRGAIALKKLGPRVDEDSGTDCDLVPGGDPFLDSNPRTASDFVV
jgi:hypothetical protein